MSLELRPIPVRAACEVVKLLHRHLPRVVGGLFGCALYVDGELVGVHEGFVGSYAAGEELASALRSEGGAK